MAKYKKGATAKYADSVIDDDYLDVIDAEEKDGDDLPVVVSTFPLNGKPFSAINRRILPKYFDEPHELFDEFGFRIDKSQPNEEKPPLENSQYRMKWLAHIQFTHENIEEELTWRRVKVERMLDLKLNNMVNEEGIPYSLRPFLWPRFCGATLKRQCSVCTYGEILEKCEHEPSTADSQIDKDLLRTMPNNVCFAKIDSPGVETLRRILKTLAYMYPDLGYCQGMGQIVASLLLVCSEETTFWIMCSLIEDILPPNYFSHSLLGLRADEKVVWQLMSVHMPDVCDLIKSSNVDISLIIVNWLLTLFSSVFPTRILFRIWDILFLNGGITIFRAIISLLKINEEKILERIDHDNACGEVFNMLSQLPSTITDVQHLIEVMISFEYSITHDLIKGLRKKYLSALMTDSGMIFKSQPDTNLPKMKINKRQLVKSKTILQNIFQANEENEENDPKTKNIRQTEIVVDLRNAIIQICKHFATCSEAHESEIHLQADYSPESHESDRESFFKARREGRKRAKALLDFQRQEEDELGFNKNDIITIVSETDEHCWVGEINGCRGWFPAKFVELIDERGKNYCINGDEAVDSKISDLIRGPLAMAFRRIMFHGIRESSRMISSIISHPWPFIESLASSIVEHHNASVNSRLALCDAFKLDQDGKVLTPEELLYRAVQDINFSHNAANAQLDVKLRSLLVYALNEQCLHLWFEIFCDCPKQDDIRKRYYHSSSFIRTPAWKHIKCELRLLAQCAFNLNVNSEIAMDEVENSSSANGIGRIRLMSTKKAHEHSKKMNGTVAKQPLKEGVRDMLIKHHLFSWDL